MMLLWLPAGLLLPVLSGWLLVRLIEGQTPVLRKAERVALGFLFGVTGTMFVTFLAHIAGFILFTRAGFLGVQIAVTVLLLILRLFQWRISPNPNPPLPPTSYALRPWLVVLLLLLTLWTVAKIVFGSFIFVSTPPYFDDTLKNWNFRAKVFYETHTLDSGQAGAAESGVLSSYPPTVSLAKASLAALAGEWHEGLINSPHVLWFLAALTLLFYAIRRQAGTLWALLGVYLLSSLPLYFFHGVNAYADVFLSAHLFAAGSLLASGLTEVDQDRRRSFRRLGALALAALVFTKNEALVLYLPLLLFVLAAGLFLFKTKGGMARRDLWITCAWVAGMLLAVAIPWVLYKWTHGLGFGNAKDISTSYEVGWQPGVLYVLWVNTFFEGNWNLLFPAFFVLLALQFRRVLASPLLPLLLFVLLALALNAGLFLFTSLSVEAFVQTGLARGFVQLAPLIVMVVVVLARDAVEEQG